MPLPLWRPGDVVVRRELIGLDLTGAAAPGVQVWFGYPVHIVDDTGDELVSYVGPGAEFGFVEGRWPTSTGVHPWTGRVRWEGHGCLMVQRCGDPFAVWHYWHGPAREFLCWYVNIQAPFRRTPWGYDTQDFELDILVFPDGSWRFKDRELLPARVAEGYLTASGADAVRALGDELGAELRAGTPRWDDRWAAWTPPATWCDAPLRRDWAGLPTSTDD